MNKKDFNKIYLNCRRGILELDIILINFLENEFTKKNKQNIKDLECLLKNEDQDLYLWIVKGEKTKDKKLSKIISKIKESTKKIKFV